MTTKTSSTGRRPRRDREKENFWRRILQRQAASGQDIRAFCRQQGLSESSFHFWRHCIAQRDRQSVRRPAPPQPPSFVELRPQPPLVKVADTPLELLAGNRRLLIRPGCDRALLRDVLDALGE